LDRGKSFWTGIFIFVGYTKNDERIIPKKIEYICVKNDYKMCSETDYSKCKITAQNIRMVCDEEKSQKIPTLFTPLHIENAQSVSPRSEGSTAPKGEFS
jgi:hypothetical protein